MAITIEALRAVGATAARAAEVLEPLKAACAFYGIDTPQRLGMFLAQVGHESGGFRYAAELWGPTAAQVRYEGRRDLGNTQPGDGERFKGHGFIQTTGRANHVAVRDRLRARFDNVPDFEAEPERLTELQWACLSAADYWDMRNINAAADAGDFERVTRLINGGLNGLVDRIARWERVKAVLLPAASPAPAPGPAATAPAAAPPDALVSFAAADTIPANPPTKEAHMAPFIAAALPALIDLVPKLGAMFSSGSAMSERNIKAAELVISAAKDAIGATNEQELVEKIARDPAAAEIVRKGIEGVWYQLQEVGGGIAAAREAADRYLAPEAKGFWHNPAFWISLVLLAMPLLLLVDVFFVHPEGYDTNLRTQIVTGVLMVISIVGGFWLGSSMGSQKKTEALTK